METSTVCFFGDYDETHARTKLLIRGLELKGVTVLRCHADYHDKNKYQKLQAQYRKMKGKCDAVFLGHSPDRRMPLFARLTTLGKPLLWDIQFSFYDNYVFDRKLVSPGSPKAFILWAIDWINCRFVDRILLDTYEHFRYFEQTFGVAKTKLVRVSSSADTAIFYPRGAQPKDGIFRVEYHGKYIPVQGVDVVVRAAKLLADDEGIQFVLIGDGQERAKVEALAQELGVSNVTFLPFIPLQEIPPHLVAASVCIGLIGDIPRVARTVANKLYEAAAMGRVSINADVPAIRELFTDGEDVLLIRQGSAEELAKVIRTLRNNPLLVQRMGDAAYATFKRNCSPEGVGEQLMVGLRAVLTRS